MSIREFLLRYMWLVDVYVAILVPFFIVVAGLDQWYAGFRVGLAFAVIMGTGLSLVALVTYAVDGNLIFAEPPAVIGKR